MAAKTSRQILSMPALSPCFTARWQAFLGSRGSWCTHDDFKAFRKCVEILGALLPDRVNSRGGLFAKRFANTVRTTVGEIGKFIEILFFDLNLRPDIRPTPMSGQL